MKKTIIFILYLGILVRYVYSQQAKFCASKGKCDDCIRTYGCAWCSDPDFKDRRCSKATESTCPGIYLVNPTINTTDFRAEPLSNVTKVKDVTSSDSSNQETIVQVSPQYLKLQLRPNEGNPYKFKLWYKQAQDYPVDLYYLMDLSNSMSDDKDKLSSLGDELARTMRSITGNFRLGFGSFVDKVVMPYVSIVPKNLKEPCTGCAAPYGFQHAMPLSQDTSTFAGQVKNANVSGNLDAPEGGFDAIMQAIVCRDEIGWREHARKLLVFSTDSSFHYAGDGKLGGIIKPNDGCCHLDRNGLYTHSTIQDYPSVSQINWKVKENFINLIFAVTADHVDLYTQLSKHIEGSFCGALSNNSENIVELVKEQYNKIRSSVEWREKDMLNIFGIRYFSKCLNPDGEIIETNKCENLTVGQMVEFEVELELKTCPPDPKDWRKNFSIYPVGVTENLFIEVELLCGCNCEDPAHSTYEANSPKCSYHGTLKCGVCECYPGYSGEDCGCTSDNDKTDRCHPPNVTQLCSGRGSCKCNKCYCDSYSSTSEAFYGDYCECNDFNCPRIGGKICSGRGACKCGKCICEPGWIHEDCSCENSTTNCIPAGSDASTVCSGKGNCVCNKCVCHEDNFGKYCNRCPNCKTRCDELKNCVQCKVHQSGPLTTEECDKCTANITVVEYLEVSKEDYTFCSGYDDQDCRYTFMYEESGKQVNIVAQKNKECPPQARILGVVFTVITAIVLIGLAFLVIWKCYTWYKDHREFAKFEQERSMAKWDTGHNPIYKQATSTFKNPTYCGS